VVRGNFIDVCKKREGQLIEYLSGHTPLRDINGQPLVDECWGVFNGKQVVDF
jgi:hypothetical protein